MISKEIIKTALKYVGTEADPPGNVIFNTHYYGGKVQGSQFAWCVVFIWDVFRMSGASKLFFNGKKTAACSYLMAYAQKKEKVMPKNKGQLGDVVLFNFSGGTSPQHVGFILKRNDDGTYLTVEGNTSAGTGSQDNGGCVAIKKRYPSQVVFIYRPKYDQPATEPAPDYKVGKKYMVVEARTLRSKASTGATSLGTLKAGTEVEVQKIIKIKNGNIWLKVTAGKKEGYVAAYYLRRVHVL